MLRFNTLWQHFRRTGPSPLMWLRFLLFPLAFLAGCVAVAGLGVIFVVAITYPQLPSLETITDYQPKIPLRVYTAEGALIGEFGEERRTVVAISAVPATLRNAILAAEDERFYQHSGVDYVGVMRAAYQNLSSGGRRQGASTITMQVARNFFLSTEKTLTRKLYEALLAFKIEANLNKDQILELYVNQIYLGQRAYGFAAAAQIYYGKSLENLTLAETAMLAGLPKAPSTFNPVANPQRAKQRQLYVLRRMKELAYIGDAAHAEASKASLQTRRTVDDFPVKAEYVAELVRQAVFEQYPNDVYTKGFRVYTTIRQADQQAANAALRRGLIDYDRRHGYRGPEGFVELPPGATEDAYDEALSEISDSEDMLAALVLSANPKEIKAVLKSGIEISVTGDGVKFASRSLDEKATPQRRIRRGALIRVQHDDAKSVWQVAQLPDAEAAFIALEPHDGAVRALVGGFDFSRNKFNHVTQAWRQPGSSFKPFIYSASLEKGFTPATVVPDEPLVVEAEVTGSQRWEPKNYDGKYEGPMSLRSALAKSKNMVSVRVLQDIGPKYAQDYVTRFGFEAEKHPPYLTMALGAGSVTPLQMARAYSVFANGGYLVQPYFIDRIVDDRGNPLGRARPQRAGDESLRAIDARNAFIMDSMMQDVTRYGTAGRAAKLGRKDLAGKTGTTNEHVDAWFCGYSSSLVGVAWVGFDQPKNLGRNETGGQTALPIWMGYMERALKGVPEIARTPPTGVITVDTGGAPGTPREGKPLPEFFYRENVPKEEPPVAPAPPPDEGARPTTSG